MGTGPPFDGACPHSFFEQVWLPNLSRYLPPEFHDEFHRRLKMFMLLPASGEQSFEEKVNL